MTTLQKSYVLMFLNLRLVLPCSCEQAVTTCSLQPTKVVLSPSFSQEEKAMAIIAKAIAKRVGKFVKLLKTLSVLMDMIILDARWLLN